jgi:hypothetical protein
LEVKVDIKYLTPCLNHKKELLRWLWLSADFLIIWLAVYFLPSPMSDDLRGLDELPLIYDIGWIPILLSFVYFSIWHTWKDIFLKTALFFLASVLTYDWQILTIEDIFSNQMLQLIFSEKGLFFILIFLIMMSISYGISALILKVKKYLITSPQKL